MLIVNQIENTHFSKTEKEIVDYIIDQGMNIEKMSANEIARNTFTSAPLLVRIAKKLGYSVFKRTFLYVRRNRCRCFYSFFIK